MYVWNQHRSDVFRRVFTDVRTYNRQISDATSEFSHVDGTRYFLTDDLGSGFAIRPDGELVFVFSTVRGRGANIVSTAVKRGADRLDCFEGYLTELYARHGFVEYDRDDNWTPGGPDVVWMAIPHVCYFDRERSDFWCTRCGTVSDYCKGVCF